MILKHSMCIPQKGRTFCDIFTCDACVSGGASFFSAECFLDGILLFFLFITVFHKDCEIEIFSKYKLNRNRGGIPK